MIVYSRRLLSVVRTVERRQRVYSWSAATPPPVCEHRGSIAFVLRRWCASTGEHETCAKMKRTHLRRRSYNIYHIWHDPRRNERHYIAMDHLAQCVCVCVAVSSFLLSDTMNRKEKPYLVAQDNVEPILIDLFRNRFPVPLKRHWRQTAFGRTLDCDPTYKTSYIRIESFVLQYGLKYLYIHIYICAFMYIMRWCIECTKWSRRSVKPSATSEDSSNAHPSSSSVACVAATAAVVAVHIRLDIPLSK